MLCRTVGYEGAQWRTKEAWKCDGVCSLATPKSRRAFAELVLRHPVADICLSRGDHAGALREFRDLPMSSMEEWSLLTRGPRGQYCCGW